MNFKYLKQRERKAQSFDKSKISLKKAGKIYNVYDKIQEAREDTEIYPTLEKYGCIDKLMLNTQGVYADFTAFKGLRDMKEQQKKAEQMFYELPLETRKVFNNDINQFVNEGEKWLKTKIQEEQKKNEIKQEIVKTPVENQGEVNNG